MPYNMKTIPGYVSSKPGIQVGTHLFRLFKWNFNTSQCDFDEDGVKFLQQLGVEWIMVHDLPESADAYRICREQMEERGLKVYRIGSLELHNMPDVTLNLPGRDRMIERYLKYISDMGSAGIRYSTYAHMGNGIWRNLERKPVRGGGLGTALDLNEENEARNFGEHHWPLSHGREYSEDEIWENYRYFIKKVVPVAEEYRVFIGVHPDDPPVCKMAGVPRCIFSTVDGYSKAFEIADSPNIGVCLCVGCWLEGGDWVGSTPVEFIRRLLAQKKLFKVHVRNVTAPIYAPGGFIETFPDDGYGNLAEVVQALDDGGFDGCIMNDHLVEMVGGWYTSEAYFTGYLKGLVDAVQTRRTAP